MAPNQESMNRVKEQVPQELFLQNPNLRFKTNQQSQLLLQEGLLNNNHINKENSLNLEKRQ